MLKIIITGNESIDKLNIAKRLQELDDNLSIVPHFTTENENLSQINERYTYFINHNIVNLSYKNNSLLYVITKNYISTGVTTDDFYNNDILSCNYNEYNNISNLIFDQYDILTILIDSSTNKCKNDINEVKFVYERLQNNNYIYFLDENEDYIVNTIYAYITGDEEQKNKIIFDNN